MSNLLAQLVLARRNPDDGWGNILFLVVAGVIYMVVAIVNAMKSKSGDKQQQQQSRKPPAHDRGGRQQMPGRIQLPAGVGAAQPPGQPSGDPKKRPLLAELRAAAQKLVAEAEQAFQVQPPKPPEPVPTPQIEPETTPHIEPVVAPSKGLAEKQATTTEMPPTEHLSDLLSDYADPDKLRRAILHYEILGPPLALRD